MGSPLTNEIKARAMLKWLKNDHESPSNPIVVDLYLVFLTSLANYGLGTVRFFVLIDRKTGQKIIQSAKFIFENDEKCYTPRDKIRQISHMLHPLKKISFIELVSSALRSIRLNRPDQPPNIVHL